MGRGFPNWYKNLEQLDPKELYTADDIAKFVGVRPGAVRKSLRTRGLLPDYRQVEKNVKAYWKGSIHIFAVKPRASGKRV